MDFIEGERSYNTDIGPWLIAFAVVALVFGLCLTGALALAARVAFLLMTAP